MLVEVLFMHFALTTFVVSLLLALSSTTLATPVPYQRPSTLEGRAPFPMPHPGPVDESKWVSGESG
ncbi:hypothetical protein GJ744_009499 [Endocarpon pusillum]|uniref:Uncharacterized protein n=1 Tax=Endocarpon pusillum TaxID=364733 RepID=A0A8H7AHZ1_9EURO|nr:hypothetical protein GJ744_009499 [Endocarpon pusillum]